MVTAHKWVAAGFGGRPDRSPSARQARLGQRPLEGQSEGRTDGRRERSPEFVSALGTEYFVLQSMASSTISESGSRVSIYLSSLASGLVALGFSSSSPRAFASLAFTVLPTVFVLGWFTIVRLIDTSVANIVSLRRMELIRAYYAALAPVAG